MVANKAAGKVRRWGTKPKTAKSVAGADVAAVAVAVVVAVKPVGQWVAKLVAKLVVKLVGPRQLIRLAPMAIT